MELYLPIKNIIINCPLSYLLAFDLRKATEYVVHILGKQGLDLGATRVSYNKKKRGGGGGERRRRPCIQWAKLHASTKEIEASLRVFVNQNKRKEDAIRTNESVQIALADHLGGGGA